MSEISLVYPILVWRHLGSEVAINVSMARCHHSVSEASSPLFAAHCSQGSRQTSQQVLLALSSLTSLASDGRGVAPPQLRVGNSCASRMGPPAV